VEDLLHERSIDVRHETIRFSWNRFGPIIHTCGSDQEIGPL
jgi:putative transposase